MRKLRFRLNTIYYCIKMGLGIKYWFKKPVDIPKPEMFHNGVELSKPMLRLLIAQYAAAAKTITRYSGNTVYEAEDKWLYFNSSRDKIIYLETYQYWIVKDYFYLVAKGDCKFCKKSFDVLYGIIHQNGNKYRIKI